MDNIVLLCILPINEHWLNKCSCLYLIFYLLLKEISNIRNFSSNQREKEIYNFYLLSKKEKVLQHRNYEGFALYIIQYTWLESCVCYFHLKLLTCHQDKHSKSE